MTSQGLSKELYDLGLRIETEKWWGNDVYSEEFRLYLKKELDNAYHPDIYPAPSSDELLAVLPDFYTVIRDREIWKGIRVNDIHGNCSNYVVHTREKTPAEALGLMAKWLLTEGGYHYDKEKKWLSKS